LQEGLRLDVGQEDPHRWLGPLAHPHLRTQDRLLVLEGRGPQGRWLRHVRDPGLADLRRVAVPTPRFSPEVASEGPPPGWGPLTCSQTTVQVSDPLIKAVSRSSVSPG